MKAIKWIGIVFVGLLLLGLLMPKNDKDKNLNSEADSELIVVDTMDSNSGNLKVNIDSAKIKELKPLFKHKKDEFSEEQTEWITPIASARYRNENGIYCYFSENNLRFVFQYHADDWLFIKNFQFLIDDKPYSFTPDDIKRDNDETGITEWFDSSVNSSNGSRQIVEALAKAKSARVRLNGDNYHHITNFTAKQLKSIKNTLEYYNALGYTLN
ncbi:hypothetical protein [Flavobacterium sp. UMI-01]|uniref:hypothetical protein n=1 Tax=Flavobacterium sp. UMI-01 TaxID=1441053 RepID=UPI001C7D2D1D|nr:hypothetical protein [Flavobacterium sp. UMI-01]GIZ10001.1 hypothetical protein FUMI01_27270 [Flavobacterium sp. UMI-01]